MPRERAYWTYMMMSDSGTLYVGVTGSIVDRVWQHKTLAFPGFASTYRCTRLVWREETPYVLNAIAREKQLKRWRREKKLDLIERHNPGRLDLAAGWYEKDPSLVAAGEIAKDPSCDPRKRSR